MWICVGLRDPSTKPSRGWLRVGVSKPNFILAATVAARNKVTTKTRAYWRGCSETTFFFKEKETIFLRRSWRRLSGRLAPRSMACEGVAADQAS